jgi:hypothetical protein
MTQAYFICWIIASTGHYYQPPIKDTLKSQAKAKTYFLAFA